MSEQYIQNLHISDDNRENVTRLSNIPQNLWNGSKNEEFYIITLLFVIIFCMVSISVRKLSISGRTITSGNKCIIHHSSTSHRGAHSETLV